MQHDLGGAGAARNWIADSLAGAFESVLHAAPTRMGEPREQPECRRAAPVPTECLTGISEARRS